MQEIAGLFNYIIVIVLMMIGLYITIANRNLVKKLIGLNVFQVSIFMLFISMGFVHDATAPIAAEGFAVYSSPLPHVLILTAIVVGISTTALGLALVIRIYKSVGTIEEDEINNKMEDME
ncbi:MAG: cation:proton antiporter subunit C [Gammaproteobacteria bacterium]|nr:cation:proton antiporter subunit C [Gammaproteobacteria bacterium]